MNWTSCSCVIRSNIAGTTDTSVLTTTVRSFPVGTLHAAMRLACVWDLSLAVSTVIESLVLSLVEHVDVLPVAAGVVLFSCVTGLVPEGGWGKVWQEFLLLVLGSVTLSKFLCLLSLEELCDDDVDHLLFSLVASTENLSKGLGWWARFCILRDPTENDKLN